MCQRVENENERNLCETLQNAFYECYENCEQFLSLVNVLDLNTKYESFDVSHVLEDEQVQAHKVFLVIYSPFFIGK